MPLPEPLEGKKVRSAFQDKEGRLWFGSKYDGIIVIDDDGWGILTPQEGLAGWEVKEMIQDSNNVLWLGTEDGVSRIESIDAVVMGKGRQRVPWSWGPLGRR
jgi:ligand-binding sensor domain-containing protein